MDATELGRWTRFAAKGGIGKCTALQDCVAEAPEDLMFLTNDEITVLMQVPGQPDVFLGYCEGVVGNFRGDAVRFHGRLKKPVLTKRQSAVSPVSRPSSSQSAFTVAARDVPSPAILSPTAAPSTPAPASPAASPHPERSMSLASSLATPSSSTPVTPAEDDPDDAGPSIAIESPHSSAPTSPIHLGDIAKQLATDSPVDPRFESFDTSTTRFPTDRDSSIYDDSEASTRISVALSDGGVGIGLSLLQDFAGGDGDEVDDGESEDEDDTRRTRSPESTVEGAPNTTRSDSLYSQSPRSATQPVPPARTPSPTSPASARPSSRGSLPPPPLSARSDSHYSGSPQSYRTGLPPASMSIHSESEYGGEDWEGADDIYDDYRYSRYSVASRMSRFSKGSMHTLASTHEAVPPIPTEHSRPSLDSIRRDGAPGRERKGSKESGPSKLSESATHEEMLAADDAEEPMSRLQKNRPAPLTFKKEPEPSPLLHATFGSPQASPTAPTATTASFASPTLMSPVYPTNTGAATSLRQRLERERDDNDDDLTSNHSGDETRSRHSTQDVTAAPRDETMPLTAVSQTAEIVEQSHPERRETPPPTPAIPPTALQSSESSALAEKRRLIIANDDPASDQPPPPPYSATAPHVASSSQAPAPAPALAPQPGPSSMPQARPQARPIDPNRPPAGSQPRQSLFMPHPGAPQPPTASAGPMYGRQPAPHPPPPIPSGPPPGSIHHILQVVLAARREGRSTPPTIYARFEWDLALSVGPVPISFAFEPQNNVPANRALRPLMPWTGTGAPSRTGSPASLMNAPVSAPGPPGPGNAGDLSGRRSADPAGRQQNALSPPIRSQTMSPPGRQDAMSPPTRQTAMSPPGRQNAMSPPGRQVAMSPPLQGAVAGAGSSQPIPRANFTPSVPTARPRSRSFSGFTNNNSQEERMQALARGSREEGAAPLSPVKPLQISTKRSKSAMATTTTVAAADVPTPQRATVSHASSVVRGTHAPSPLSLSQNNVVATVPPVRSPPPRASTNPLPTSSPPPADALALSPGPGTPMARALSLDQVAHAHAAVTPTPLMLNANGVGRASPSPQTQSPLSALQESIALTSSSSPPSSPRSPGKFPRASPVIRHSRSAVFSTSSRASEGTSSPRSGTASLSRPSVDTQHSDIAPSIVASPASESPSDTASVLGLRITKRSRPQMPPLRLVTSKDSSSHDPRSPTLSVNTMNTSASEYTLDQETVQVQDMDFELVRPIMPASPFAGSVESLPIPSPVHAEGGFLRTDSPAMSTTSHSSHRHPTPSDSPHEQRPPKENTEMEAHRQRELRWVAALSSTPAAQARKSKKIRKLVLEGVPASVRYQVWAALADSKGKRMDGLYQRLAQREHVPAYASIERDIEGCFTAHPQLQDGSLAKLLQAYLCMVPDVRYSKGLALIAGQLLLQSPEEDAFWTFISLMDTHLRPYFSNGVQLEVDASLFAKALESNDAAVAKKVFGDMGIPSTEVCRVWFMAVFADSLPADYLLRVWDVFLFEGVTFLFRAGLAIFVCCRRLLLQSTSPDIVLEVLAHPPLSALPPNPDAFVEQALSVKLKDDDVRKQRNKLEAQVKRRTQPRASPMTTTPTISLPKS